ncbi:MAG: AAA family ATPase [Bacteroidia bacterium]
MKNGLNPQQQAQQVLETYHQLLGEVRKVIVGQENVLQLLIISLFARGHALLIGVPGLAKTLMISTLARVLNLSFQRIQFTPDLMPADILGSEILQIDPETGQRYFRFAEGPIFTHILLADEVNRTPPKTQSALLEAMQERAVSLAGQTRPLPEPFFVLATQNPIEQEGTYPLPEAQLDRFMLAIYVNYPTEQEEMEIVTRTTGLTHDTVEPVLPREEILAIQKLVRQMPVAPNVIRYAVQLARRTRPQEPQASPFVRQHIQWGVGPRAGQFLILAAKVHALLHGKFSPDVEDVQAVALPVLRHRMVLSYQAEAEGILPDHLIQKLLDEVPVV